jgi:succinyl-diaminopimelate desuccinylase
MMEEILAEVEQERNELVELAQDLVRIPSPNPPGETREVSDLARRWLEGAGLDVDWVEPSAGHVNLVATLDTGRPGMHLVMNAHLDVFPVEDEAVWELDPWSGEVQDGKLHGRGVTDMKAGAAVFMHVLRSLSRRADRLRGRGTVLLVCDEESFGPYGSRYLLENRPELLGDALLSTEPSGQDLLRIGERGMCWSEVTFAGPGGHGAYPAERASAVEKAAAFVRDLRPALAEVKVDPAATLITPESADRYERAVWPGAAEQVRSATVNFGQIHGGVRVNMQAALCRVQVDMRVPPGSSVGAVREILERIASRHEGSVDVFNASEPNVSDPAHELLVIMREEVEGAVGRAPLVALGVGCTDTRLWRHRGVPAGVFGPKPYGMGAANEYCTLQDLAAMARVHTMAAHRYLAA